MNFGDIFKDLKIDAWYKVLAVMGLGFFILAILTPDLKVFSNAQLALLSAGAFLIGFGYWINETHETWIIPPNVYSGGTALKATKTSIKFKPTGCFFCVLGGLLLILFLANILFSSVIPSKTTIVSTSATTPTIAASPTP